MKSSPSGRPPAAEWATVRDRMVEAFAEVGAALQQCRTEDDLLLVLELAEHYPQMARNNLRDATPAAMRIEAMRTAVRAMRTAVINPQCASKPEAVRQRSI